MTWVLQATPRISRAPRRGRLEHGALRAPAACARQAVGEPHGFRPPLIRGPGEARDDLVLRDPHVLDARIIHSAHEKVALSAVER